MNDREAKQLVETVLNQPFDVQRLGRLVVNIFADMQPRNNNVAGKRIPESFRKHVRSYRRVGKVEDDDGNIIDVLAVKLASARILERARTSQRNFIARYLNGAWTELRDAALVAFYCDDSDDWRFSLVRMDYSFDEANQKIKRELTPARRFSFLVGPHERTHTAQQQLAALLTRKDNDLESLEHAFNIETVTKEFFGEYKRLFLDLKDALDALTESKDASQDAVADVLTQVGTANFAKRLLGQIVFLYFLQKKGWLGVPQGADWGAGSKTFLRDAFDGRYGDYDNFFNDLLEPLFYHALATKRDQHYDHYYAPLNCAIPFLNGGLFEPIGGYDWQAVRVVLDNALFANILNVFDRYNFTVREDEPLEKEVAVDPEMLGKVFENLLEVNDRKSQGAFYTPREIVHYMCQESLINYLDTALNTTTRPMDSGNAQSELFESKQGKLTETVVDVRVPKADLETLVRHGDLAIEHDATTQSKGKETNAYPFKLSEAVRQHARTIDSALAEIKICDPAIGSGAFPVGMMNEIVRARSALSTYLANPQTSQHQQQRSAYAFKRHAIQQSIYGVDIDAAAVDIAKLRLWLSLVVDEEDFTSIKPLPNLEYKIVVGNSLWGIQGDQKPLYGELEKLENLQNTYFHQTDAQEKQRLKVQIDGLLTSLGNGSGQFDFRIYFSEVFRKQSGFDVVIGNPPYISYGLRGTGKLTKPESDHLRRVFSNSAEYKLSVYAIFMELGLRIAKSYGIMSYIVPDSFLLGRYFSKIRHYFLAEARINEIVLVTGSVFEGATVGTSVIFNITKDGFTQSSLFSLANHVSNFEKRNFSQLSYSQNYFKKIPYERFRLFFRSVEKNLVDKMESERSTHLIRLATISSGLIGKKGKSSIVSQTKESSLWQRGLLSGSEVHRYSVNWDGGYILFDKNALKSGFKNARYHEPKLFGRQTGDRLIWSFDNKGYLCLNNLHVMNKRDEQYSLKYLLGLANSSLMTKYYNLISLELGRALAQTDIETLEKLPIRTIDFSNPTDKQHHDDMVKKVEKMLDLHKQKAAGEDVDQSISDLDAQIDALVYALYDLTEDEIAIVEGAA